MRWLLLLPPILLLHPSPDSMRSEQWKEYEEKTDEPWKPGDLGQRPGDDEDIEKIKSLLGGDAEKNRPMRWQRPPVEDPSENKHQMLLDRIMLSVEGESKTPEEFTENYRRVIEAMKSRGMVIDNADDLLQTYLSRWTKAQQKDEFPEAKPISPQQTEEAERNKRMNGLMHGE